MTDPVCAYVCIGHRGKVEWHHPISKNGIVGVHLCEAHHSLLQGRKKQYQWEYDMDFAQMRAEVYQLVLDEIKKHGYTADDIDKY
jgi:hypothetical protein